MHTPHEFMQRAVQNAWTRQYSEPIPDQQGLETLPPADLHRIARAFAQAGADLLTASDVAGQAFLALLWEAERTGLYLYAGINGAEYNTLVEWADVCIDYHDRDYVRAMARVVERVFRDIQGRLEAGDPYYLTSQGEVITRKTVAEQNEGEVPSRHEMEALGEPLTPEKLIETPNIIKRLKMGSYTYDQTEDPGERASLLGTMLTAAHPETVKERLHDAQENNGSKRYRPVIQNRSDGLANLTLEGLTVTDLNVVLKLLRPIIRD